MKKLFIIICLSVSGMFGQFNTPTINGTIDGSEYGDHTDGQNKQDDFYMTWDDSNLYIGITSSDILEAAVIYLDKDPLTPINGGSNSNGTIVGQSYDGVNFAELQFRADIVVYVKSGYREYRTANGSGGWSGATTGFGSYSDNGSDVREFSIPWSAIGGRPSSFAWFGFVTSSGGYVYNQVPEENPGGFIGTSSRYVRYYIVNSTEDGSSTMPFSRNSYVFNSTTDVSGFGAITVYDFTMNTSGRTITRSSTGLWTINGSLVINNGTINFGSCNAKAKVSGNLEIGSSGTLTLSSASGGDLEVAGNWNNSGTFNCNEREVLFNGTSQSLTGNTTFDYLRVNNTQLTLNNNVTVDNSLTFDYGIIDIGSNNLTLNSTASIGGTPSSSKMIVCTGTGEVRKLFTTSGSFTFPVGDNTGVAEYSPVTLNFTSGTFGSGAYAGVNLVDAKHPNNTSSSDYITRYWKVTSNNITSFSCNASFVYLDSDINGDENLIYLGRYKDGSWTLLDLTNTATNTLSGTVSSFSEFTGGESGALPVELTSFTVSLSNKNILLNWTIASEKNNYGFEIERSSTIPNLVNWEKIGFVSGHGNSNSPKEYSFIDNTLTKYGKYYYRLKQIDNDGSYRYSDIVEVNFEMLSKYSLDQNYPNPFNPSTIISYQIPENNFVTLKVYDIIGNEIATLVNEYKEAGRYDVEFNSELIGKQISNGVYIYKIQAGDFIQSKKMILIK